jgi:hypothetical protein
MSQVQNPDESRDRRAAMLRTAMGPAIAAALADPLVVEVMVNPDGVLRLDRLGEGRSQTKTSLTPGEVERVIRLVASHRAKLANGLRGCCRQCRSRPVSPSASPPTASTAWGITCPTGS